MTLTEALEEFERESMGGTLALFGEELSDEALMVVWEAAKKWKEVEDLLP